MLYLLQCKIGKGFKGVIGSAINRKDKTYEKHATAMCLSMEVSMQSGSFIWERDYLYQPILMD
jgi:hypothetical protein